MPYVGCVLPPYMPGASASSINGYSRELAELVSDFCIWMSIFKGFALKEIDYSGKVMASNYLSLIDSKGFRNVYFYTGG